MKRYILKTVQADGSAYGNFQWPLEVGAEVVAPDWDPTPQCGGGLHGLLNGVGNGGLLNWDNDAVWIVAKVPKKAQLVDLDGKVKVDRCKVVFVGNQLSAISFLQENGCDGPIVGATVVAGNNGTATAGDRGTATAGNYGTATAGDYGTATAGDCGTATAGYYGTAIAGGRGTATAGDYGTAIAGDRGTATAGYCGTATAGYGGTATAGYGGTATAGDCGTATAGYYGTATAGDYGTVTAGYKGTATAGYRGTIQIRWHDGDRYRTAVGYVGENGILPNVAYRVESGVLCGGDEQDDVRSYSNRKEEENQ